MVTRKNCLDLEELVNMEIKIGDKVISNTGKPYFIADVASNHDGSLEEHLNLLN